MVLQGPKPFYDSTLYPASQWNLEIHPNLHSRWSREKAAQAGPRYTKKSGSFRSLGTKVRYRFIDKVKRAEGIESTTLTCSIPVGRGNLAQLSLMDFEKLSVMKINEW